MPIAISDDRRALSDTASDFLRRHDAGHDARSSARALLDHDAAGLRALRPELAELAWLGLRCPRRSAVPA